MPQLIVPDYYKLSLLKSAFEGFEARAYQDTGKVWTVGFGSTYNYDAKRPVIAGDYVSRITAIKWLELDYSHIVTYLNYYIKKPLSKDQATAIVDYIYNRGIGTFLKTRLDEFINNNPLDPKIKQEILSTGLWDRLGHLLWGLGRRRRTQAYLYFTGQLKFNWTRWGATF